MLSRLAFWALPTPPWKPWKAWKWWKRLARQRGRRSRADGFFLCGLVVDATTRSDTTCSRRWGQTTDLSARLADSASQGGHLQSALLTRPNGQLTRAGQFYHSITGRCSWRCDSCGTSIAGREPASGLIVPKPSQSLQPRGRPAAQASCPSQSLQRPRPSSRCSAPGPHSRCSAPGAPHSRCSPPGPSQWLQPPLPSDQAEDGSDSHIAARTPCKQLSWRQRSTEHTWNASIKPSQSLHSRCTPQAPSQFPDSSQWLQPPEPSGALTVAAASKPTQSSRCSPPRPSQSLEPQGPHCSSSVLTREDG